MSSNLPDDKGHPSRAGGDDPDSPTELMLSAGLELLDDRGLSLTFESISYTKVFDYLWDKYEVRVTRGSVHERIWNSPDEFRRDVLNEVVAYFPVSRLENTLLACAAANDNPDGFAKDLGARTVPALIESQISGQVQSVKALASRFGDPLTTETLHRLLDERTEAALDSIRPQLPHLLAAIGLAPKVELALTAAETSDLFCVMVAAIAEGGKLNRHAGSHDITAPVKFMSAAPASDQPWRIFSIGIKCLLDFLYEPETKPAPTVAPVPQFRSQKYPDVQAGDSRSPSGSARRTRAQLKRLILTTAVELLLQDVLNLQPELLDYTSVFAHIKTTRGITIHRASIHGRIWETNNEYRLAVLARSLAVNANLIPQMSEAIRTTQPALRGDGTVDRQQTAYDVIRNANGSLVGIGAESVVYRRLLQVKAALIDQQDSTAETVLRAAVADAERQRMQRNKADLQTHVLDLGYQVKPGVQLSEHEASELFHTLAMTTVAGTTFRELAGISSSTRTISLPSPSQNGQSQDWTPAGVAVRSYFDQLYEQSNRT